MPTSLVERFLDWKTFCDSGEFSLVDARVLTKKGFIKYLKLFKS